MPEVTSLDVRLDNIRLAVEDAEALLKKVLDELEGIRGETREKIESLVCSECDAGNDLSLAEAIKNGWTRITYAPDLPMADFVGVCGDHASTKAKTGFLFPQD